MIRTLTAYPAYKDSGVSWLGEVPAHWEVKPVKRYYAIQLGKMLQTRPNSPYDIEVPYLKAQHIQWFSVRTSDAPRMWASPRDIQQFGITVGDLLVCEGGEGGRCGIVKEIPEGFIIQNSLHRVRPRDHCRNDYLQYVMSVIATTGWFDALNNKATIAHFTREKFGALYIPIPSPNEQTAIVRFLDHMDRRIRRAIRARKKRINLLEECKQALIHQAVTGEIDVRTGQPYPAYKPAGVEWLGKVPEHWEVRKLRALFTKAGSGTTPSGEEFYGGDIPWVVTGDLNDSVLTNTTRAVNARALETFSALRLYPKDSLIVAMYGATIGKTAILGIEACTNQACCVLAEPRRGVLVRFIQSAVISTKGYLVRQGYGGGQPNINSEIVHSLRIPVPPCREQTAIVEYLDAQTAKIDAAIAAARREIELLREYRERLVSDVVTGKVDVREVAARLPEEPSEEESEWMDTEEMAEVETADNDAASEALSEEEVEI